VRERIRKTLAGLFGLGLSLGLGGCGDDPRPPEPVQVTLGGAAPDGSGFLPLQGDVTLIPGAQGGFHVWLKYRTVGMTPGPARVEHTARRASDGRLILTSMRTQDIGPPSPDGYWELPVAIPAFMCPAPIGVQVRDERVIYRVVVEDMAGTPLGEGEASATPRCPTDSQSAFCLSICSG